MQKEKEKLEESHRKALVEIRANQEQRLRAEKEKLAQEAEKLKDSEELEKMKVPQRRKAEF